VFSLLLVALCAFRPVFRSHTALPEPLPRRGWVDEPDPSPQGPHPRGSPYRRGPRFVAFAAAYGILLLAEFGGRQDPQPQTSQWFWALCRP